MDVYGYNSYPYNQSDEIAKQMYAQQALSSNLPFPRSIQGSHSMPAPQGTPWNIQGLPWGMQSPPQLVQFTAQPPEPDITPVVHCKRKSLDVEPVIPTKQLITEEKMAAHLSGLHISSDYTTHTFTSDDMMDVMDSTPMPSTSSESSSIFNKKLKGHTIVLSEEVKMIKDEPLIPASLIERLEKPTMSLVVWKPRENILEKIKEEEKQNREENDNNDQIPRRNGVLVPVDEGINDIEM